MPTVWRSSSEAGDGAAQERFAAVRRRLRPENELPVSVAVDGVLLRGPDLVVSVCGARAFSTLIEFRLMAASRIRTAGALHGLGGALFGHGDTADRLLLGVEFSDGRTGNNLGGFRGAWETGLDPASPALMPGGGGGDRLVDLAVFLSPLPPPGDLRIIAAWPARGLPETVTVLEADRLLDAASRAVTLWELPDDEPPPPPPPPQVPPGSWFDRGQD